MARTTVGRASPLWLGGALIAVGGFLFWLFSATRSLETAVTPVLGDEGGGPTFMAMTVDELRGDPAAVVGRTVGLEKVPVAARLGRGAFTIRLDDATSYPVLLDRDLIQLNTQVYGGDVVKVWGHIFTFNDSIRDEWVRQTAVDAESAGKIPQTPSFLLADSLEFVQ
ncbi:MAG: hypothetical protein ACE5JR_06865 [Gemmatimonadota bacterium]